MDTRRVEERWGSAEFTHTLAEVSWMASPAVGLYLNERATGDPARDWLSGWARRFFRGDGLRVLVLGCGEGWLERALATWPFVVSIDAVDVAASAVARADEAAKREGLTNIRYGVVDLNRDSLAPGAYEVVVAHSILHHIDRLEHAFDEIERSMTGDGTLIVNEYIGPRRFQFSDDVLEIINRLLACLPARLRRSAFEAGRVYERRERPTVEAIAAADPSEAVRSDELRTLIEARFEVIDRRELGGAVLQQLLYDIVQNFRFDVPRERAMLEILCAFEGMLVDRGAIPSDFAIYAARKRTSRLPRSAYSRPPVPRPAAALDVDPDPLGFGRRKARRTGRMRSKTLPPEALRILRSVLASTGPRRRNLISEQGWRASIEQTRYALALRTGVFDWVIGRWLAVADLANEDDRVILALLEAFEAILAR